MAVPTHFFKVVVGETASGGGDLEMEAYVMPNEAIPDSAPLASFQVSTYESLANSSDFKCTFYGEKISQLHFLLCLITSQLGSIKRIRRLTITSQMLFSYFLKGIACK